MINRGFSLIELLVTLTIIGILAMIAYPSYLSYVVKAKRSTAEASLVNLASLMESYYNAHNTYSGATLSELNTNSGTDDHSYQLEISSAAASSFLVQAVPQGNQATLDSTCGTLTYDQLGNKGITGTGTVNECW